MRRDLDSEFANIQRVFVRYLFRGQEVSNNIGYYSPHCPLVSAFLCADAAGFDHPIQIGITPPGGIKGGTLVKGSIIVDEIPIVDLLVPGSYGQRSGLR